MGGGSIVLSHGTLVPCPQSQKTIVPTELSGRLCFLPHCLQANQIMRPCPSLGRKHGLFVPTNYMGRKAI
jgi:hypothetical protein